MARKPKAKRQIKLRSGNVLDQVEPINEGDPAWIVWQAWRVDLHQMVHSRIAMLRERLDAAEAQANATIVLELEIGKQQPIWRAEMAQMVDGEFERLMERLRQDTEMLEMLAHAMAREVN